MVMGVFLALLNSSTFILCKSLFFNFFITYICCKIKE
jgi:hypothetical protein